MAAGAPAMASCTASVMGAEARASEPRDRQPRRYSAGSATRRSRPLALYTSEVTRPSGPRPAPPRPGPRRGDGLALRALEVQDAERLRGGRLQRAVRLPGSTSGWRPPSPPTPPAFARASTASAIVAASRPAIDGLRVDARLEPGPERRDALGAAHGGAHGEDLGPRRTPTRRARRPPPSRGGRGPASTRPSSPSRSALFTSTTWRSRRGIQRRSSSSWSSASAYFSGSVTQTTASTSGSSASTVARFASSSESVSGQVEHHDAGQRLVVVEAAGPPARSRSSSGATVAAAEVATQATGPVGGRSAGARLGHDAAGERVEQGRLADARPADQREHVDVGRDPQPAAVPRSRTPRASSVSMPEVGRRGDRVLERREAALDPGPRRPPVNRTAREPGSTAALPAVIGRPREGAREASAPGRAASGGRVAGVNRDRLGVEGHRGPQRPDLAGAGPQPVRRGPAGRRRGARGAGTAPAPRPTTRRAPRPAAAGPGPPSRPAPPRRTSPRAASGSAPRSPPPRRARRRSARPCARTSRASRRCPAAFTPTEAPRASVRFRAAGQSARPRRSHRARRRAEP